MERFKTFMDYLDEWCFDHYTQPNRCYSYYYDEEKGDEVEEMYATENTAIVRKVNIFDDPDTTTINDEDGLIIRDCNGVVTIPQTNGDFYLIYLYDEVENIFKGYLPFETEAEAEEYIRKNNYKFEY